MNETTTDDNTPASVGGNHRPANLPRRRVLLGAAAVVALPGIVVAPPVAAAGPDAAPIRLCAEHIANKDAFNASHLDHDVDPLWPPNCRTRDAVRAAKPLTIAGIGTNSHAIKSEVLNPDGSETPEDGLVARWAFDLVNDLLRLHGAPA
jgi:hypothetical protein